MKLLIISALILTAFAAPSARNVLTVRDALGLSPKIISGKPAVEGQFPWQVLNQFKTSDGTHTCGGSLIASHWVLTAAHCADGAYEFKITLGSLRSDGNLEEHAQVIVTDKAIVHPDYDIFYIINDLALIDLKEKPFLSRYIQVIKMGTENLEGGIHLTISGWGKISDESTTVAPTLNFVELLTISNQNCKEIYGSSITDGTICCVGAPEHSPCNGDSGGPLVQYKDESVYHNGIASFVHDNGCASGNPSAYARTSYYRTWILDTIANN